jgi:hypothetical protein
MFHAGGKKLGELRSADGGGGGGGGGFGLTQAEARQKLEAARVERSAGRMDEKTWHETMEKLSPIANPRAA